MEICPSRSPLTSRARFLELKNTVNTMVDQLSSFAAEVTRVGSRGWDRRQAGRAGRNVRGVAGHVEGSDRQGVNSMAGNLTAQVRNIAAVTNGRRQLATCSKKITVDVKGEILELKDTINTMVDQLRSFCLGGSRAWPGRLGPKASLGGQADVRRGGRPRGRI